MAQELTLKVAGLFTDPNPIQQLPSGALSVADNIQIKRQGSAEGRPSFPLDEEFAVDVVEAVIPFDGGYTVLADGQGSKWWLTSDDGVIARDNTVLASFTMGSDEITLSGPEELLIALDLSGQINFVNSLDGHPAAADSQFDANTEVLSYGTVSAGERIWTLTKPALASGSSFKYTRAIGVTTGNVALVPVGSTTMPITSYPDASWVGGYLNKFGERPGEDDPYFAAFTQVTAWTPGPGATLTFDTPTIGVIPATQFLVVWRMQPSVPVGAIPSPYVVGETSWAEMQKRLYVTLESVLARYDDAGSTSYARAGMPRPAQPTVEALTGSESVGWISLGDMVAYRAVVSEDVGDQLLLSAPSAPSFFSPTDDWTVGTMPGESLFWPTLKVKLPDDVRSGDSVQIYRTLTSLAANFPTTPGDEMRLLVSIPVTVQNAVDGFVTYEDKTPDSQLTGAALYTNQTQQGILNANVRPPRMGCVTTYADMMFGGNVSTGEELVEGMVGIPSGGEFDYLDPARLWPVLRIAADGYIVVIGDDSSTITITGAIDQLPDMYVDGFVTGLGESWDVNGLYPRNTTIMSIDDSTPGVRVIEVDHSSTAASSAFQTTRNVRRVGSYAALVDWAPGSTQFWVQSSNIAFKVGDYITNLGSSIALPSAPFLAATQITNIVWGVWGPTVQMVTINKPLASELVSGSALQIQADYSTYSVDGTDATAVVITGGSPVITIIGPQAKYAYTASQEVTDWDQPPSLDGPVFSEQTEVVDSSYNQGTDTTTLTVDKPALTNSDRFAVWDWVAIDGHRYYGAQKPEYDLYSSSDDIYLYDQSYLWSLQGFGGEMSFADPPRLAIQAIGGGSTTRTLAISTQEIGDPAFTLTSSKPLAFVDDVDAIVGVESVTDENLNRVIWSKTQEPDAWPLPYFVDVGSASARVLRVLPTRESLFIFKEDGIWRMTGFSPLSMRLDEYDRTARLIHPNAISQIDNNIIGWFVSGILVITDAQTANISDNQIGEELSEIRKAPAGPPWVSDIWAFTVERDNQWILIHGNGVGGRSNEMYVYNLITSSWVKWDIGQQPRIACGIHVPGDDKMRLGGSLFGSLGDAATLEEESDFTCQVDGVPIEMTNISGDPLEIVAELEFFTLIRWAVTFDPISTPDTLSRGDAFLVDNGMIMFIDEVISPTSVIAVSDQQAAFADEDGDFMSSIVSRIEWTAKTQQNPGKRKHWREVNFPFFRAFQVLIADAYFSSDVTTDAPLHFFNKKAFDDRPAFLRGLIPREAARGVSLNPRIEIPSVISEWRLDGCNLVYEWMSERTGR